MEKTVIKEEEKLVTYLFNKTIHAKVVLIKKIENASFLSLNIFLEVLLIYQLNIFE